MKLLLISLSAVLVLARLAHAAPPPDDLVQKLTAAIRQHCPDATIAVTNDRFTAKNGTMMYTLHSRSMTGAVSPETYQKEGPNYKGFMLSVALEDGEYQGQPVVPQTLREIYYDAFIDAVPVEGGAKHYEIGFAYGSRLDPELKKAIFDTLPNSITAAAATTKPHAPPATRPALEPGRRDRMDTRH